VAAPSRVLVDRAIDTKNSQYSLLDSAKVQALMPVDGFINFSGIVYQDLGSVLGPIAEMASGLSGQLTPEQQQLIAEVTAESLAPALVSFYGEENSLRVVGTTEGGLLGGAFGRVLAAGEMLSLGQALVGGGGGLLP